MCHSTTDAAKFARRADNRGQALVEFAASAMVLFAFVFGIVELGRAVFAYNTISHAAREVSRYAMTHGSESLSPVGPAANNALLETIARRYAMGLISNRLTVTSAWTNVSGGVQNAPGATVTISVNYLFVPVIFDRSTVTNGYFMQLPLRSQSSTRIVN